MKLEFKKKKLFKHSIKVKYEKKFKVFCSNYTQDRKATTTSSI